ncbi:MAG: hypothetical protein WD063_19685 [Pirellulales bacterium]
MNGKSLFGRLADSRTALRTAERQEYFRPNLELLEERKLLVATVYYNDDWINDTNPSVAPVAGDIVSHPTDFGGAAAGGLEYGFEAFGKEAATGMGSLPNIQDALDAGSTDNNATVNIGAGTHIQSDIIIQRPISLVGEDTIGVSNTVIIPEVASANTDGDFPVGTHSGIIIQMSAANLVFSGSDGVSISALTLDGGLGAFSDNDYQHGVTTLYTPPGGATVRNGTLAAAQWGFAGDAGTNETNPNLNIDGVTVRNTRQTGITVSPLINQTYDTGPDEPLALNIFNSTVENVGPAGTKDATRIGILMQNINDNQDATGGNMVSNTVSNVGVGIKMGYFGTLDFGNQNAANNGAYAVISEVDDADVYAYWIQAAREAANLGLLATGGADGTGFFLDNSRLDGGTGFVSTGYKIGVHVQDSSFAADITPYLAVADLTGPGIGVAGSVGILVDNNAPYETILEVESVVTVTGFQTGIKVEQVVAHADPNILQLDRPILTGNATELYVGNNSRVVGNYDLNTDITIAGTGIIDPRATNAYNFDGDGPDFYVNSTQPAPPNTTTPVASPDKADTIAATNITLGSGTTYSALLTGESGAETDMWTFDDPAIYPGVLVPPLNWDHTLTDPQTPYGALTDWSGQVVQDGITDALVLGGTATNGHGLSFLYGGDFTQTGPIYVVVPTDLTGRTHMNLELKLDATSAAKLILFGLVDSRGNTESWTIPTSMLNPITYTTVRINMLAPSLELTEHTENYGSGDQVDVGINLAEISGYVFGGDQGLGTNPFNQDIPLGFSVDNYSHTSQMNSQLEVSQSIDLGGATLAVELRSGYVPAVGTQFKIVNNTGGGGITGIFAGLPEGTTFLVPPVTGVPFQITYVGGTISPDNDGGNDVVIERVAFTASVTGRHLFYNNSKYDGLTPGIAPPTGGANNDDVDAIDTSKSAYLPGAGSSINPVSMSSYNRGINGVFVDITGTHGPLSLADFQFAMSGKQPGINNTPSTWVAAPAPTGFTVLTGVPAAGTDRVEFIWDDTVPANVISNRYLEVTVEGNDAGGGSNLNTGLAASSYFYYGSRIGSDFVGEANPAGTYITNAADEIGARTHPGFLQPVTNVWDYNKDSIINAADQIIARGNGGFQIKINITGPPPPAPAAFGDDGSGSAVASALAAPSSATVEAPTWISTRLAGAEPSGHSTARIVLPASVADNPRERSILAAADKIGEPSGMDDELLDSILADLSSA